MINGVLQNFDIVSATQGPITAGFQFEFPVVGTTGRTAVQATAVNNLNVAGSAVNLTVSQASQPVLVAEQRRDHICTRRLRRQRRRRRARCQRERSASSPSSAGWATRAASSPPRRPAARRCRRRSTARRGLDRLSRRGRTSAACPRQAASTSWSSGRPTSRADRPESRRSSSVASKVPDLPGQPRATPSPTRSITTSGSIGKADIAGSLHNSEIKTGFDYAVLRRRAGGDAGREPYQPPQGQRRPGQQRHLRDVPARQQPLQQEDGHRRARARSTAVSPATHSTPAARPAWATPAPASSPGISGPTAGRPISRDAINRAAGRGGDRAGVPLPPTSACVLLRAEPRSPSPEGRAPVRARRRSRRSAGGRRGWMPSCR